MLKYVLFFPDSCFVMNDGKCVYMFLAVSVISGRLSDELALQSLFADSPKAVRNNCISEATFLKVSLAFRPMLTTDSGNTFASTCNLQTLI